MATPGLAVRAGMAERDIKVGREPAEDFPTRREAVGAEVVDVEAAVVVVAGRAQEQIVSALVVVAPEQTRKRLLIKVSSLEIYQVLYFLKTCHIV